MREGCNIGGSVSRRHLIVVCYIIGQVKQMSLTSVDLNTVSEGL